jgi:two-component system, NarL family, response regulator DegU
MNRETIKCLLLTQKDELKRTLLKLTDHSWEVLHTTNSVNDTLHLLISGTYDVVLIDVEQAHSIPMIKNEIGTMKVAVIANNAHREVVSQAILFGAESYLLYPSPSIGTQLKRLLDEGFAFPPVVMASFIDSYRQFVEEKELRANKEATEYRKPLHLLTRRECEVLQHLAEGKSNRDVADLLYISEKTVKNHVSNILLKMKVKDRTQAVLLAIKKGWVTH